MDQYQGQTSPKLINLGYRTKSLVLFTPDLLNYGNVSLYLKEVAVTFVLFCERILSAAGSVMLLDNTLLPVFLCMLNQCRSVQWYKLQILVSIVIEFSFYLLQRHRNASLA